MEYQVYTIGLVNPKKQTPFITMRIQSLSRAGALIKAREYFQPDTYQTLVVLNVEKSLFVA